MLKVKRGASAFLAKEREVVSMGTITRVDDQVVRVKLIDGNFISLQRDSLEATDGHKLVYTGIVPDSYMVRPDFAMLWVQNRVFR